MKKSKIKHVTEKLSADKNDSFDKDEFSVIQNKNHIDDILDDYKFVRENYWYIVHSAKNLIKDIMVDDNVHTKAKSLNVVLGVMKDSLKGLMETHEKIDALLDGRLDDYDLSEKERKEGIYATVTEIVEAHEKIKKSRMNSKGP